MKAEQVVEVIDKLVGPIDPVGESYADDDRFENLTNLIKIVENCAFKLSDCANDNRNYHQGSIIRASKEAEKSIRSLAAEFNGMIECWNDEDKSS